jgi:putative transposase
LNEIESVSYEGYCSLDVRLNEQFSMINGLKENYAVQTLCNVLEVHRSSYRYWVNRDKKLNPKRLEEVTTVKTITNESSDSAGARTIATDRYFLFYQFKLQFWRFIC